jgi:hypothetical protein
MAAPGIASPSEIVSTEAAPRSPVRADVGLDDAAAVDVEHGSRNT